MVAQLIFGRWQPIGMKKRFGVAVDWETEVLPLIGCQEGTAHLPLAIINQGDYALLLDPGYPSHAGGIYMAGGIFILCLYWLKIVFYLSLMKFLRQYLLRQK